MIWHGTGEQPVHKRSSSQNMPIGEHRPSNSVILS
jgi:hypothetical protein